MHPRSVDRRTFFTTATFALMGGLPAAWAIPPSVALRGLQFLVPTPAGSQPDVIARWFAEPMARQAGVAATVINLPGAAGALAADAVLRASPESGSLLLGGLDHVAYSHLNSHRPPLDPFVDFTPVASVNRDTWVVVTASDSPAPSLQALVERSRREPVNHASNGEGSTAHLLTARLCKALDMPAEHVPYNGAWMPDLLAGRIHFVVAPTPTVLPLLRSGRLTALVTLTDERLPLPGHPPSIRELGRPDQVFHGGLFLFAPSSLRHLAPQFNRWFVEAAGSPEMRQRFRDASIEATPTDLETTGALVRQRLQQVDAMRLAVFGRTR